MIGFAVPEAMASDLCRLDQFLTVQTVKFQLKMVRALESIPGARVQIVSTPPVTDFSKVRYCSGRKWFHSALGQPDYIAPVCNVIVIKQIMAFLGCLLLAFRWRFGQKQKEPSLVFLADIFLPHVLAGWLCARLAATKVVAVITDMPGQLAVPDRWLKRRLRPWDAGFLRALLRRLDGLVVLSQHTQTDYFPRTPHLVMPGVLSDEDARTAVPKTPLGTPPSHFIVLYTGNVSAALGVDLLLSAFGLITDPSLRLWIAGKGDGVAAAERAASQDSRIKFFGFVSDSELARLIGQASVLVNLRLSRETFSRYSFPSKLLQYMASGKFVVTTRFDSLPAEFEPYLVILEEETPAALAKLLESLAAGHHGDADTFGRRTRDFIMGSVGIAAQAKRLERFLAQVTGPPSIEGTEAH